MPEQGCPLLGVPKDRARNSPARLGMEKARRNTIRREGQTRPVDIKQRRRMKKPRESGNSPGRWLIGTQLEMNTDKESAMHSLLHSLFAQQARHSDPA